MSDEQKQKRRDRQKKYQKNMTDEQKQKQNDYLRKYKKYYAEKKLNNKIIQHDYDDDNDDNKIIKIFNDNLKL